LNTAIESTDDLDPAKLAGMLELSLWLGRRLPESAQSIAQGEHWYAGAFDVVASLEKNYQLSTRAIGALGLILSALGLGASTAGIVAGGATSFTGVGAVGMVLSALGATASIDLAWASATQIVTGEEQASLSGEAIYALGAKLGISEEALDMAGLGLSVLGFGALGVVGARMLLRQLKKGAPALSKAGAWALRQAGKGSQNLQAGGRGMLARLQEQRQVLGTQAWQAGETVGHSWVTRPGWMLNMRPVEIRKPPDPALWQDGASPPRTLPRYVGAHKAEDLNLEAEAVSGGRGPWMPGTKAHTIEVPEDTRVFMVINKGQQLAFLDGYNPVGGWGTPYSVPNSQFPRTGLAIIPDFKPDVDWIVILRTRRPMKVRVGVVGPQSQDGIFYPGGGRQWNFLDEDFRSSLEIIGKPMKLKKGE
jgi:hypothetical protein